MVSAPEIDIVTSRSRWPIIWRSFKAAIEAGKQVYCEWPLGNGLAKRGTRRRSPGPRRVGRDWNASAWSPRKLSILKQLIADGFVGEVLSTTLIARGGGWAGSSSEERQCYLLDKAGGATMLTISDGT